MRLGQGPATERRHGLLAVCMVPASSAWPVVGSIDRVHWPVAASCRCTACTVSTCSMRSQQPHPTTTRASSSSRQGPCRRCSSSCSSTRHRRRRLAAGPVYLLQLQHTWALSSRCSSSSPNSSSKTWQGLLFCGLTHQLVSESNTFGRCFAACWGSFCLDGSTRESQAMPPAQAGIWQGHCCFHVGHELVTACAPGVLRAMWPHACICCSALCCGLGGAAAASESRLQHTVGSWQQCRAILHHRSLVLGGTRFLKHPQAWQVAVGMPELCQLMCHCGDTGPQLPVHAVCGVVGGWGFADRGLGFWRWLRWCFMHWLGACHWQSRCSAVDGMLSVCSVQPLAAVGAGDRGQGERRVGGVVV